MTQPDGTLNLLGRLVATAGGRTIEHAARHRVRYLLDQVYIERGRAMVLEL